MFSHAVWNVLTHLRRVRGVRTKNVCYECRCLLLVLPGGSVLASETLPDLLVKLEDFVPLPKRTALEAWWINESLSQLCIMKARIAVVDTFPEMNSGLTCVHLTGTIFLYPFPHPGMPDPD